MPSPPGRLDDVSLPWLVTVRWTGVLAQVGAIVAGVQGLSSSTSLTVPASVVAAAVLSNVWLSWRLSRRHAVPVTQAGCLIAADVAALSWLLHGAGGVLNPASVFFLVYIVLAALVLDRVWAWTVTALSIGGYGLLFLAPTDALALAGSMHPEIGIHVRGMWLAFAATSLIVAVLVGRLVALIDRRDRALADLRERAARDARLAAMTTLAAGAAHELSTPLATIAVAARELELALDASSADPQSKSDARLIRGEVERCRRLLHDMAARISQPLGEASGSHTAGSILDDTIAGLAPMDRGRVQVQPPTPPLAVVWPSGVVVRALVNVLRNALQASDPASRVFVAVTASDEGRVSIAVTDSGTGMSPDVLARAGEPFFTTKEQGGGTGLGLFVARATMEQLGGGLTIRSGPGEGTTVTMTLPRHVAYTPGS
jgi:two-component system sensor histidine kinase RegB